MSIAQHTDADNSGESGYPRTWRWDEDGERLEGTFVEFDEGPSAYGTKPIVVLTVNGEPRSLWLLETAARSRFADEVAKRPTGDLTPGEKVIVERGDKTMSAAGREYRKFAVRFPDAPKRDAKAILGDTTADESRREEDNSDDGIPF